MKVYFTTSNKHKLLEFRHVLEPEGIEVEGIDIEIPEIRDEDVAVVAREKARWAAEHTGKAVVAEDTGLYINALKGFPGSCAKFVFFTIGIEGILKLLRGKKDRNAEFVAAIAMAEPRRDHDKTLHSVASTQEGKEPRIFVGRVKGTIAEKPRGKGGFGYDPVFVPDGKKETYAELCDGKCTISHRAKAVGELLKFLNRRKQN